MPKNKLQLVESLMQNAAFMKVQMEELQQIINEEGAIKKFKNGNGFLITQEHPAQKSYNVLIQRYTAIIKQLTELLPDNKNYEIQKAGEELAKFIAQGKPKK